MGIGLEDEAMDTNFEEWVRKLGIIVTGNVPEQGLHFMSTTQIWCVDWNPHLGCEVTTNGLCPLKLGPNHAARGYHCKDGCGLEVNNNSLKNIY